MKNTIIVLIVLLPGMPVFAQQDPVKTAGLADDAPVISRPLNSLFRSGKRHFGMLYNNHRQWDSKRFTELYDKLHHIEKEAPTRRVTFMNGPVIFSQSTVGISSSFNARYPQYLPGNTNTSTALTLLGIVGGIVAGSIYPNYVRSIYHTSGSAVAAYLESTYYQHDR